MASEQNFISLKGKAVIITGASAGIGESTAIEFARQGCLLTLTGRDEVRLKSVVGKCLAAGDNKIKVEYVLGDLVDKEVQSSIVTKTLDAFGQIDVLVNNAAVSVLRNPLNTDLGVYHDIMRTNVESVFFLTQMVIPHLIRSKGNIVNLSSIASNQATPTYTVYAMSKAAMDSYTKSLSVFLAPHSVRVNSVNPGSVDTLIYRRGKYALDDDKYTKHCEHMASLHPLGQRQVLASEVADAVVFLASDRATFITGQILYVAGGRHNIAVTCTA